MAMDWGQVISGGLGLVGDIYSSKKKGKIDKKGLEEQKREFDIEMNQRAAEMGLSREQFDKQFGLAQNQFGLAQNQFGLQQQQFGEVQNINSARRKAYEELIARGNAGQQAGETELMNETASAPAELGQIENDINAGTSRSIQEGQKQMQANLAQQGVRGGQAVTQLRRGVGDMQIQGQENINQMKLDDATRRRAIRSAYLASKAGAGQQANLSQASF